MRILVTRSQPSAAQTAAHLRARGHEPIIAPLFEMELLADVDPKTGPWDAILLTSANGLWGIVSFAHDKKWHGIPVFAVGDVTAKAARDMRFADVTSAGGNVNDLVNLVAARLQPPARLLYLAGEDRAGDLAGALRAKNFEVDLVVVYRFLTAQLLPEPAATALRGEIDAVLHFSRASAEDFLRAARSSNLIEPALTKPVHFCLSEQVAAPLREAGAARIQVAARPTQDALLELCG
ncbi:MAG: uroporphyrinogen-III synthase [Rhizobiales bacterium]|nr:uroporphyrinogen-III synthase [Hyphomicrobiales bacterium]